MPKELAAPLVLKQYSSVCLNLLDECSRSGYALSSQHPRERTFAVQLPAGVMVQPLQGEGDYYDGVLVDVSNAPADDAAGFSERLQLSLQVCLDNPNPEPYTPSHHLRTAFCVCQRLPAPASASLLTGWLWTVSRIIAAFLSSKLSVLTSEAGFAPSGE